MQAPNAQGLAGLMSQGRAPQPAQGMPSPAKASPMAGLGSVEDRVAAYRGNPAPLQQRYQMSQDLLDLLALQKIKSEKEAAARQMQLAMGQQAAAQGAEPPTVAQQREKEVLDMTKNELAQQRGATANKQTEDQQRALQQVMSGGIARAPGAAAAAQPKAMASGGIVAFAEGGEAEGDDREKLRAAIISKYGKRAGLGGLFMNQSDAEREEAQRIMTLLGAMTPEQMRKVLGSTGPGMPPVSPTYPDESKRGTAASIPAPATPPVAPTYPDESMRGSAAGILKQPAAPVRPPAATPSAPGMPGAAPSAPGMPAAPGAAPAQDGLLGIGAQLGPLAMGQAKRDPAAEALAEEQRVEQRRQLTPEQRAVYDEGIAGLRKMYEQQYDPERQSREGLKQFLIGAGGRRYNEFGGGAATAMGYDEAQRQSKLKDFADLQKARTGLVDLERKAVEEGIAAGKSSREQGEIAKRTGIESAAGLYRTAEDVRNKELDRQVERMKASIAAESNRINRQGLDLSRAQTVYSNNMSKLRDLLQEMDKNFAAQPGIGMLLMADPAKLSAADKARLETAQIQHELAKRRLKAEVETELAPIANQLGMGSPAMSAADRALVDKYSKGR